MNPVDVIPSVLLGFVLFVFLAGVALLACASRWYRLASTPRDEAQRQPRATFLPPTFHPTADGRERPRLWLAVHHPDAAGVFSVLGLDHPQPSHWSECAPGSGRTFVSVPINGWTLITGDGLPDPADDVDRCYKFLINLSIAFGHVQMFCADALTSEQAWARLEAGRVIRAYAWAGTTLWHQGAPTLEESRLGLRCLAYAEDVESGDGRLREQLHENLAVVPALAARWSLDPADLESIPAVRTAGLAGYAGSIVA